MDVMEDKWDLKFYQETVNNCEDIIAEEAINWKTADDINYYYLSTYAKAILTARETLCLLWNGYPDGALSRAREVYERMVITFYINNNYSDELMGRYFANHKLSAYKIQKLLYEQLKNIVCVQKEPYQQLENDCKQKIDQIKLQYGKINGDYWWVLDNKINSFNDMQDNVGVGLLLILYKRACISTHAGALSDIALLGRDNKEGSLLRTDQTEEGFETPILLLLGSFDILTQIVFKHFNIDLPNGYNLKEKYEELWKMFFQCDRTQPKPDHFSS